MPEFVMVPVPADRVLEVYAFLLDTDAPGASSDRHRNRDAEPAWTDDLIAKAYLASPPGMRSVFDYLSDHAGEEISAEDLAAGINRARTELPGILGAFSRRAKNRYFQASWPFRTWDEFDARGKRRKVYEMDDRVAEIVHRVSRELSEATGGATTAT